MRIGDHQQRYSDREGRKGKRRRDREGKICGMSHEEGMSSDDDEVTSQMVNDRETLGKFHPFLIPFKIMHWDEIEMKVGQVFSDTLPEYSSLKLILEK